MTIKSVLIIYDFRMVYVSTLKLSRKDLTQEEVNQLLRPGKRRFGRAKHPQVSSDFNQFYVPNICTQPDVHMVYEGVHQLRHYRRKNGLRFHCYIDNFGNVQTNFRAPPKCDAMRVIRYTGEDFPPFLVMKRRTNKKFYRPRRRSYQAQLEHHFELLDKNFELMEKHLQYVRKEGEQPTCPKMEIECRKSEDFESCHWNRFPQIWMIYINALNCETFMNGHIIDLDFSAQKAKEPKNSQVREKNFRFRLSIV